MNHVGKIDKKDCTGCKLCEALCPVGAIHFETDKEGFWYPDIDETRCIKCGKCVKQCPSLHENARIRGEMIEVYSAWTKDDSARLDSTSGGVFYELANWFISNGGVVAGCRYTSNWKGAEHFLATSREELSQIMGSKYFQSNTSGIYTQVKEMAAEGYKILFSGSPCQINAMRNYLGERCENVYYVDFICRSINSPKAFSAYIEELEEKYQSRTVKVRLKDKTRGWQSLASHIFFENGQESLHDRDDDYWIKGFIINDLFTRESCYYCKYRQLPRVAADISMGDFWGIQEQTEEDMHKGISVVLINTDKGKMLFEAVADKLIWKEHTIQDVIGGNPALLKNPVKTEKQEKFFRLLEEYPFSYAVHKCIHITYIKKMLIKAKNYGGKAIRVVRKLKGISVTKFLYYNFFSKNIIRKEGWIIPYRNAVLDLSRESRIYLDKGELRIGINKLKGSRAETHIRMEGNAVWNCRNGCHLFYNTVLEIKSGATFDTGFFSANGGSVIIVDKKIAFGEDVMIGRNVLVYDSDFHQIRDKKGIPTNYAKDVVIEDHVWLTSNISVLKGVTIGKGSIVTSQTVITKCMPEHSIIAGGGAGKVIKNDVDWSRNTVREADEWFYQTVMDKEHLKCGGVKHM